MWGSLQTDISKAFIRKGDACELWYKRECLNLVHTVWWGAIEEAFPAFLKYSLSTTVSAWNPHEAERKHSSYSPHLSNMFWTSVDEIFELLHWSKPKPKKSSQESPREYWPCSGWYPCTISESLEPQTFLSRSTFTDGTELVFATLRNKRWYSNSTHVTVGHKISQKGHRFWPRNSSFLKSPCE
jgi:hypothetical protein